MSVENKLGKTLLDLSEVIKSNTITAMAKAVSENSELSLTDRDLATLAEVIGSEIDMTVRNSMDVVLLSVKGQ